MIRDIFYDTEFLDSEHDDGHVTTELISIALCDLDGREYYAIVADPELMDRAWNHETNGQFWLRYNVTSRLPGTMDDDNVWVWDDNHPDFVHVKDRATIAAEVFPFIWNGGVHRPRLWAYFSAHDHICLTQLWGPMIGIPAGIPWRTNCLEQYREMVGYPEKPPQPRDAHDARADARWNVDLFRICQDNWKAMVTHE